MTKKLTAAALKRLKDSKPPSERLEVRDGGATGLYVVKYPTGAMSWAMKFRKPNGKLARTTLGAIDDFPTIEAARVRAAEINAERANGVDVIDKKQRARLEQEARNAKTGELAIIDFVTKYASRETRRWQATARLLGLELSTEAKFKFKVDEVGFKPRPEDFDLIADGLAMSWKAKPIDAIDEDVLFDLIETVRDHGVPGLKRLRQEGDPSKSMALLMFTVISKMFRWLKENRRIKSNPVLGLTRPAKNEDGGDRVLIIKDGDEIIWDEMVAFWQAAQKIEPPFSSALRLLLLTGCRKVEVSGMERSELSTDGSVWTIAKSRTKNGLEHKVFLSPLARQIIASVPVANGKYVFTTTNGRAAIAISSKIKRKLDAEMKIPPWTIHDVRRTIATGMATIGALPHVIEAVLNHASGVKAGVAGVYNRSTYDPERKVAWQRWSDHVESIVSGKKVDNVTPIRKAKS